MDTSDLDKQRIEENMAKLTAALRIAIPNGLTISPAIEEEEEDDFGGWDYEIATWSRQPGIYLALNKFLGGDIRHFWVGFYSPHAEPIDRLHMNGPPDLQTSMVLKNHHTGKINGIWALRQPLSRALLSGPILEHYRGAHWFGIYDVDFELSVPRAVSFLSGVVDGFLASQQEEKIRRDASLSETEREQLIKARIGQGAFREGLMAFWKNACSVSDCDVSQVLRASHIQSWKDSDNKARLDPENGLLLNANLDALFDKHLISFDDYGRMMVSSTLSDSQVESLGLTGTLKMALTEQQKKYLSHHRTRFHAKQRH